MYVYAFQSCPMASGTSAAVCDASWQASFREEARVGPHQGLTHAVCKISDIYIYIYIYNLDIHIYIYILMHTYIPTYIHIYIHIHSSM